jgi:hypothetical protein
MKSSSLPPVRVDAELRAAAESVLARGETLSEFIEDSVRRRVEFRRAQAEFHARADASAEHYRKTGESYSVEEVLAHLQAKLDKRRKEILG